MCYGYRAEDSRPLAWSFLSRFRDSFDGPDFGESRSLSRIMGTALEIYFVLVIILVLLNLLIAVMTSAYEEADSSAGGAEWTQTQYDDIVEFEKFNAEWSRFLPFCRLKGKPVNAQESPVDSQQESESQVVGHI